MNAKTLWKEGVRSVMVHRLYRAKSYTEILPEMLWLGSCQQQDDRIGEAGRIIAAQSIGEPGTS